MKVVFTRHIIEDKIPRSKVLGWNISKAKIRQTIKRPRWKGLARPNQETAMVLIDNNHILRVIFERQDDIITVITFHVTRRGRYEST